VVLFFSKKATATRFVICCQFFYVGKNKPEEMDPKLFVPILDHHCLPDKLRIFLRFGVPEIENNDEWRGELTQKDEESCFPASDDYWDVTTKTVTTQQIQ